MKKKDYIIPSMELLDMELERFLCASHDCEDGDEVPFNEGEAGDDEGF